MGLREGKPACVHIGEPQETQRELFRLGESELTHLLADLSIHIAYRRSDNPTPHAVLRQALKSFGWPEEDWPKVRSQVESWLAEQSASPSAAERAPRDELKMSEAELRSEVERFTEDGHL